jgi:hypothetical protein
VAPVRVDEMTNAEAHALLTAGLAELPVALIAEALEVTGRSPVLLSLVHGTVGDAVRAGGDAEAELQDVLAALRVEGITALDVANPSKRSEAVTTTIEVSLRRLTPDERSRYEELAVFGEDVTSPVRWWPGCGHTPVGGRRFTLAACANGCSTWGCWPATAAPPNG